MAVTDEWIIYRPVAFFSDVRKQEGSRICTWVETHADGTQHPCERPCVTNSDGCAYHSEAVRTHARRKTGGERLQVRTEVRRTLREGEGGNELSEKRCTKHGVQKYLGGKGNLYCPECIRDRAGIVQAQKTAKRNAYYRDNPRPRNSRVNAKSHDSIIEEGRRRSQQERIRLQLSPETYDKAKWEIRFWKFAKAEDYPEIDLVDARLMLRTVIATYPEEEHTEDCKCLRCHAVQGLKAIGGEPPWK